MTHKHLLRLNGIDIMHDNESKNHINKKELYS